MLQSRKAFYIFVIVSVMIASFRCNAQYIEPYRWAKPKAISGTYFMISGYVMGGQLIFKRADKIVPGIYLGAGIALNISAGYDWIRNRIDHKRILKLIVLIINNLPPLDH
jgi:hypothetical protein